MLVLAHAPALLLPYGVMDDFPSIVSGDSTLRHTTRGGRPVYGLLSDAATTLTTPDVADLWTYRAVALAGLVVFMRLAAVWLTRVGWTRWYALAGAVLLACLLPMQVFANWAVTWPMPIAICLSVVALLLGLRRGSPASRARLLASAALLVVALSTYQPSAMTFFGLLIAAVLVPDARWLRQRRAVLALAATGVAAMLAYTPVVFVGQAIVGAQSKGRSLALPDPLADGAWLVGVVVPKVAELWNASPAIRLSPLVIATIVLAAAATLARTRLGGDGARRRAAERALLALALLGLTASPVLMVSERYPTFRSQTGLTVGLCVVFLVSLRSLLGSRRLRPVSFALVAFALFLTSRNTLVYYALPQTLEWRVLKQLVRARRDEIVAAGAVHVVRPHWQDGVAGVVVGDEFGLPSLFHTWVPVPMTHAALRANDVDPAEIRVTHAPAGAAEPAHAGPVLDMTRLRSFR